MTDPTLGIQIGRIEWEWRRLLAPPSLTATPLGEVLRFIFKTMGIVPTEDPLVLDLDGDGLEFTSLGQNQAHFDLDGDLFAEKTGWLRPDDGFLVLDRDGNGAIDDISELFGAPGVPGFTELAALDSNGDGVIDAADSDFALLQIWQDLDSDGVSDAGELSSLTEAGIVSIDLGATAIDVTTSSDHHLAGKDSAARSDLKGETVLTLERGHRLHDQVRDLCDQFGASLSLDYEGTSLDTLRHMVAMGMGISFLPALYVRAEVMHDKQVVARPVKPKAPFRMVGMVWRRHSARQDEYFALAGLIRGILKGRVPEVTVME